jgi:tetratricopeptide (TPR) repeat protein
VHQTDDEGTIEPAPANAAVAGIAILLAVGALAGSVAFAPDRNAAEKRQVAKAQRHLDALDFDAAREVLDALLGASPSAQAYELSAVVREAQSDVQGALLDVDQALRLDPARPTPYARRAALLIAREQRDDALADLVRAIELGVYASPDAHPAAAVERSLGTTGAESRALGDAHARRARELLGAGDAPGSLAAFDRAFARDPLPTHAYDATRAALATGDRDAALERLERAYASGLRDWRRIKADERVSALRADPRFEALLRKMGAP